MTWDRDDLVIPASRTKLMLIALGALAFVILGGLMVWTGRGLEETLVGIASVVFFGACFVSVIPRLLRSTPAVIINRDGIIDSSSGVSVGLIRWHEIATVRQYEVNGQKFLGIVPTDLDAILARQPKWKRAAIRASLATGGDPINIPQVGLSMKVSELARVLTAVLSGGGQQSKHD